MGGLFGGGQQKQQVPPLQEPPKKSDAQVQAEGTASRRRLSASRGRASTILNTGEETTSAKKKLFGAGGAR